MYMYMYMSLHVQFTSMIIYVYALYFVFMQPVGTAFVVYGIYSEGE